MLDDETRCFSGTFRSENGKISFKITPHLSRVACGGDSQFYDNQLWDLDIQSLAMSNRCLTIPDVQA